MAISIIIPETVKNGRSISGMRQIRAEVLGGWQRSAVSEGMSVES